MEEIERNLILECQQGDTEKFGELVLMFQDRAYAIAYSVMGNSHDAMDMTQESFIKAFKNINKFNFKSSFNTWLYKIVKNTCIDQIRKNKRKKTISIDKAVKVHDGEVFFDIEDSNTNIEEDIEKKEMSKKLYEKLDELSNSHKQVLLLCDIQGYDYKEISDILNLPIGTIKSRISRARIKLVDIMEKDGTF